MICELPNKEKYEYLPFPSSDRWGAVMLKSHPLAKKKNIKVSDLIGQPLFCSEQSWNIEIPEWAGERFSELHLEGSFRLSYNASMFAKEGLGILLTFEHLINCSEESDLVAVSEAGNKAVSDLEQIPDIYAYSGKVPRTGKGIVLVNSLISTLSAVPG